MLINLTEQQLQKLIELLQKDAQNKSDLYLKSYLEYVQRNESLNTSDSLDEIPF